MALSPEFKVKSHSIATLVDGRIRHRADRLTPKYPLTHGCVQPFQTGQQCMVSAVMLNDQDMPVAFERSGKGDKPVMGRHNLGPRARRIGNATFGLSKLVAGPVLNDDAPADRVGDLSFFREC